MGTARSTYEDEKFTWNVRRKILAKGPLGRRRCRWHDTLIFSVRMTSGRHLNWVVNFGHAQLKKTEIIAFLKLGPNLFFAVMKAQ
jgi:hypothetical protein